eukprot:TRINITY_DN2088_c0_g1_i4.p3 TRINITY_DN2088_c0_g1~~TRINITY_DN2088_c0_g1_i4.p3  ORF type:complete len:109 (+),score=38.16 TRINITY_DN2088_c0_g1_i4:495-821(+)
MQVDALHTALTSRNIQTGVGNRAEILCKPCTKAQAEFSRDTLAKELYSRLFDRVVSQVNRSIQLKNVEANTVQIGVLDIYGFEIFQFISFEQLCINFVTKNCSKSLFN